MKTKMEGNFGRDIYRSGYATAPFIIPAHRLLTIIHYIHPVESDKTISDRGRRSRHVTDPLLQKILDSLAQSSQPRTAESLRSSLQVRNQRLVEALRQLSEQGKVVRVPQGYV